MSDDCDCPRLTWSTIKNTRILGRDRHRQRTLLGGLGVLGVGQMWFDDRWPYPHMDYPGWDDAPEMTCEDRAPW